MTPAFKEYIEAWLTKARHDIIAAQRLIEIEPVILDGACFHCQQAIEKSLKGFLVYKGKDIEKTHNLDFLLKQCAGFDNVFSSIDSLNINDYAVDGRYPDDNLLPTLEEAKQFYQLAIQVNTLVKELIVFSG